jgi:hypothetical protein
MFKVLMILFNYLNGLMTKFNNLNSLIFYSLVIVIVGFIGFSVCYSIKMLMIM